MESSLFARTSDSQQVAVHVNEKKEINARFLDVTFLNKSRVTFTLGCKRVNKIIRNCMCKLYVQK